MSLIQNILVKNPLVAIGIVSIFALIILNPSSSFASPVFDSTLELETPPNSKFADVAIGSSGNVYETFVDTNLGLTVATSNDGGQTFIETSIPTCFLVDRPKIAVDPGTPDSIYVVFSCDDNTTKLVSSIDGGSSFSTADVDSFTGSYDIAAENGQAYITLRTDSTLLFYRYSDSTAETSATLALDANSFSRPEIIVDNQNVSVVWTGQDNLIHFIQSTDDGDSFNSIVDISSAFADGPQIAIGGSNIYTAWVNNSVIFTSTSSDGVNFSPESSISNAVAANADIAVDSNGDAYLVWEESPDGFSNRDVFVWSSSTGNITNLSSDNTDSLNPKVRADSAGVAYVVWSENTDSDFLDDEIFYRTTSDSGNSWQGIKNISKSPSLFGSSGISHNPEIDALNGDVAIAWEDGSGFGEESSIFASTSSSSDLEIYLNSTQYVGGDTAQITVVDPGNGNSSIDVTVTSELDPVGITLSLDATVPGTFEGILDFSNGPSGSGTIQVSPDDVITVQYTSSETQEAMSFYKQGSLSFSPFSINFDRGDISHIIVQDDLAVGSGSIVVHVSSIANPTGFDLTLLESPPGSGLFGGPTNNQIIFMDTNNLISVSTSSRTTVPIVVNDSTQNTDNSVLETITVNVSSTTNPAGISMPLTETTATSGIFQGTITLTPSLTSAPSLQAFANDILTVTYGTATTHGLLIPQTDTTIGALLVNSSIVGDDTITVDYNGNIITAIVGDFVGSGGGGGGISRAGLVVQAVGAIALFGGSGTSSPPIFDDTVFTLKEDGTKLSPGSLSSTLMVGKQSNISMGFKMSGGLNELDHVGLYANIGTGKIKSDSDTYIYFDKYKTPQITIHDPHGFFKSVKVDVTEPSKSNLNVNYAFDFAKSLDNSNVVFEAWNIKRDSALKEIPGLLKVGDTNIETVSEPEIIHTRTQERLPIPEWIKSNAAWWGKGAIDDTEFTNGIGYLIQKQIINVPELLQKNTSPDVSLTESQEFTPVVPAWVKNNAAWWSEGKLTDDDFIVGIKYLLEKGIIQVKI